MKNKSIKLSALLKIIGINKKISSNQEQVIKSVSALSGAKKEYLTFFSNKKYLKNLINSKARAVLVSNELKKFVPKKKIRIVCEKPELYFIKAQIFFFPDSYFSKVANISVSLKDLKKNNKTLNVGSNVCIEKNVKFGKNIFIGNNVTIKSNCVIGNNVVIGSNVIIECSNIDDDVHICDGSIIGKKGFGFKFVDNECLRIPHIGKVIIKKGCEIGANCVVDRGSVGNTVIGENTFIDNLVHIAHNVTIGKNCILAAQVGVAGSTIIGNNVIIGGQSGISGHLNIGNNTKIGGKSGVVKNIKDNEVVMGYPAKPLREFLKNQ